MTPKIVTTLRTNSFDYFEHALITDNGFREYDVRWLLGDEINPNGFLIMGQAYGTYLREIIGEQSVVVGHDFRSYSQDLSRSFAVGLVSAGLHVKDIGLTLTPMVYFAQHLFDTRGGGMVTASHNENGWCGLKLANGLSSTLGPEHIQELKKIVYSGRYSSGMGSYERRDDVFDTYEKDLVQRSPVSRRMNVVLAAGNGTAGRFAPSIVRAAGCDVVEQDCTGDWTFPHHNPNPEDLSFLHSISEHTLSNKADLGIGIDGDGDRIGVVDDRGREVFSDKLGLLVARELARYHPNRHIVVDVKSTGLFATDPVLESAQMHVTMWKTGHSYIKAKVAEIGAIAGFEKSGHWFFGQPIGRGYDDALLSALVLLRMLSTTGRPLSQLVDELPRTWQSPTMGVYCADGMKYKVVAEVAAQYAQDKAAGMAISGHRIVDLITVNGIRFVLDDGSWGLVRASSNKPALVVVVESTSGEDLLYGIADHIEARLHATERVGEYDQRLPQRTGRVAKPV